MSWLECMKNAKHSYKKRKSTRKKSAPKKKKSPSNVCKRLKKGPKTNPVCEAKRNCQWVVGKGCQLKKSSPKKRKSSKNKLVQLKVISVNVEMHNKLSNRSKLYDMLIREDVDMICIPEANYTDDVLRKHFDKKKWEMIKSANATEYEEICCIVNKQNWKVERVTEKVLHEISSGLTRRTALLVSVRSRTDPNISFKVANLHLPGGRYDIQDIHSYSISRLKSVKSGLVRKVLKDKPDIVVGDFNADVITYLRQKPNTSQLRYWVDNGFPESKKTIKKIMTWNSAPYAFMESKGFVFSCNAKCLRTFAKHGTSIYGTTPDAFLHNQKKVETKSFRRICFIKKGQGHRHTAQRIESDHDALIGVYCLR